jgi:hypothetical protein
VEGSPGVGSRHRLAWVRKLSNDPTAQLQCGMGLDELQAEVRMWHAHIERLQTAKEALESAQASRVEGAGVDAGASMATVRWTAVHSLHEARDVLRLVFSAAVCARSEQQETAEELLASKVRLNSCMKEEESTA